MIPRTSFKSYALLGSGRVARHLQHYLTILNLPFTTWSRSADPSFGELSAICAGASHVLLAVSDPAIAELRAKIVPLASFAHTYVHFSGSARVEGVIAAHPLMTFGAELRDEEWYRAIPFVVDKGVHFADILPGIPNASLEILPEQRPFYHALCALAGNSTFLLWQKIAAEFRDHLDLPAEILAPFLNQVVMNALRPEARGLATGPVARQDWAAVRAHIDSLQDHPSLAAAYRDFLNQAAYGGQKIPEALL